MPLWGGVFEADTDDSVRRLNDSLPYDWRLYDVDITGSKAWASALHTAGLLTVQELDAIHKGLESVRLEFANGQFMPASGDEDIHTAVERRLTEIIGPPAGKLHTGRSRNDQVATDLRLWTLQAQTALDDAIAAVERALLHQAEAHVSTLMAGLTHFQPAQPITAAHWLLSYVDMLERDRVRLKQAQSLTSTCPLGSGALAGTPYPIDRAALAAQLGFERASTNSLDAVSDRDFVADTLYVCALLMTHLSRLAEDLILYGNPSFGYVTLDERFSTGSSLMPQKRNPDPLELVRGKTGRLNGHLSGLLMTLKGLPSGYNKDLQEDKEPLFDTFDTLILLLPVVANLIESMTLHPEAMRGALVEPMLATDLADFLVMKGVPFREAHHLAGRAVRRAEELGVNMSELSAEELVSISTHFQEGVQHIFNFDKAVNRRGVSGGPAPSAVRAHIAALQSRLT